MLPFRTDSPLRTTPWMNWLLILINIAVMGAERANPLLMSRYQLDIHSLELYRFISYAFLHVGWMHLLFNMLVLYILGNNINDRLGQLGYLGFYLGGAVFSGVGFLATGGRAIVGASGAVGAVMGAFLVLLPRSNITVSLIVAILEVPSMSFVVVFFMYNVIMSIVTGAETVAYEAHIAGMLFGFFVALLLLAIRLIPRQPFDFLALVQRWNRRRQYQNLVRQGYDPFGLPPPPQPADNRPDPRIQQAQALRSQINTAVEQRKLPLAADLYRQLKQLDPAQVLPRQAHLDVANELTSEQAYVEAAEAYEEFLEQYPRFEGIADVQLMLALIYARYLGRYARATECLTAALTRLHDPRKIELARAELTRIEPLLANRGEG